MRRGELVTSHRRMFPGRNCAIVGAVLFITAANAAMAADPLCFSPGNNFISAGTQLGLTSSEASTAQALEIAAQRRMASDQICPEGFVRDGALCRREAVGAMSVSAATVAVSTATGAATTGGSQATKAPSVTRRPPQRRPTITAGQVIEGPENSSGQQDSRSDLITSSKTVRYDQGVWAEAFADYEERSDGRFARQRSGGVLAGTDKVFNLNESMVRFGVVGGYSQITQFQSIAKSEKIWDLTLDVEGRPEGFPPIPPFTQTYTVTGIDRELVNTIRRRLEGGQFGFVGSYQGGVFFIDSLAKIDVHEVDQTSSEFNNRNFKGFVDIGLTGGPIPGFDINGNPVSGVRCVVVGDLNRPGNDTPEQRKATIQAAIPKLFGSSAVYKSFNSHLMTYTYGQTAGLTFKLAGGWQIDPFLSTIFQFADFGKGAKNFGLDDGYSVRLEGGFRVSHFHVFPNEVNWTNSMRLSAYSDVLVDGLVIATGGSSLFSDEGKLRGRGVFESRVQFPDGFSIFGEVSGRVGEDYWGVAGRVGGRFEW